MIGSLSSSTVAATYPGAADKADKSEAAAPRPDTTVADHVAAADESAPIRSAHATLGTLVDTYL
ncbi:hypothetical protein [Actinoplanes sp. N902-109]|uniref:hypothetical protein n=1 Tax=Actinoplanes sp. (strain N902-109) TaxID=649831 RepID=UPI000329410B|nr:hypothetical protein [Actinoplanes sp. N902-109]AGL18561.1 hypothetical protein L083_5051 [Actinoplanes sp. N902-109]